jgi:mRNA-degrading endonuclease RelE of RelBE toxin-antitoxin system
MAGLLARHDVGSVGGSLPETALDNARGRLLTLGAARRGTYRIVYRIDEAKRLVEIYPIRHRRDACRT